ncbi:MULTISPECIES: hypothetical protein [unclassified Pseudomonas]|jgi:hypothetical protein|uniref:hypothetical protein n=1 Tax=unclassified Pseudomonas TaxID=196821 RepID=UPI0012E36D45|nr:MULTISPECIES: hypothetical protein [unclassified Pseudomonas]
MAVGRPKVSAAALTPRHGIVAIQAVGQGTLSGHLVVPGTVFAAPRLGIKGSLPRRY